jgi:repressor LexA
LVEAPNRRKLEILRFIASRASKGENPPSVREVGAAVGLRSSRSAHAHLERLEEVGYVERSGSGVRTVRLTEKGWGAVLDGSTPLLGRIAAGRGLEAVAVGDEAYSLAAELLLPGSGRHRYLLRVVGQSMTEARIEDGDRLVVEEDEDQPDGAGRTAEGRGGDREEVAPRRRDRATQVPERWIRGHSGSRRGRESAGPGGLRRPPSIELLRSLMRRERGALSVEQWAKLSLNASRKGIP